MTNKVHTLIPNIYKIRKGSPGEKLGCLLLYKKFHSLFYIVYKLFDKEVLHASKCESQVSFQEKNEYFKKNKMRELWIDYMI